MVALQILALPVGVQILPGKGPLRLVVRTGDSHSSNRGSIPLGAKSILAIGRRLYEYVC